MMLPWQRSLISRGMTVEELTGLRVRLREAGGEYHVVKNTLARIALTGGKHDVIKDEFHDNIGVALAFDDPWPWQSAPTEFAKTSKLFELRNSRSRWQGNDSGRSGCPGKIAGTAATTGPVAGYNECRAHQFCFRTGQCFEGPAFALRGYRRTEEAKP